jgi:hypothetical protein
MRRRKMIKIIIAILIIAIISLIVIMITKNKRENIERLKLLYNELNTSQTYLFQWEKSEDNKTIMAKKGDKTIIDDYTENSHTTTIVKDNNTYLVLHNREEYYVYEQNNVEQTILTDGLQEITQKDFIIGTEKIKGQKYTYEEYQGSTMFMEENSLDHNEEEIKTRFYFDNDNNLVYIRTIKGVHQELLKITIQKNVEDSIFEIPSTYAEN